MKLIHATHRLVAPIHNACQTVINLHALASLVSLVHHQVVVLNVHQTSTVQRINHVLIDDVLIRVLELAASKLSVSL